MTVSFRCFYLYRLDLTYEELKPGFVDYLRTTYDSLDLTYEELKQTLRASSILSRSAVWILPMRN